MLSLSKYVLYHTFVKCCGLQSVPFEKNQKVMVLALKRCIFDHMMDGKTKMRLRFGRFLEEL